MGHWHLTGLSLWPHGKVPPDVWFTRKLDSAFYMHGRVEKLNSPDKGFIMVLRRSKQITTSLVTILYY